ncbi:MAG: TlyA family RNA methyltransferase [bacterium]
MTKKRADVLIVEKGLAKSRNVAVQLIENGVVFASGKQISKPSEKIDEAYVIEVQAELPYVGRGGFKLEKALTDFKIDVKDAIALDVGSSTGGFTDCLLQRGAKKVYAIDVGTNQLDSKLKNDPRVISMEKTDIRSLAPLPDQISLAVIDVSFISLTQILSAVKKLVIVGGDIVALVKPQFETPPEAKNKSGVVRNIEEQTAVIKKVKDFALKIGLEVIAESRSPITGGSGNVEYLLHLKNQMI